jgi:hypothetical protein
LYKANKKLYLLCKWNWRWNSIMFSFLFQINAQKFFYYIFWNHYKNDTKTYNESFVFH